MATVLTPAEIKQKIEDWITTNGNHEITGAHLNTILAAIMDYVGVGYAFMGEAPASAPSPDVPVAYLAGPGSYTGYDDSAVVVSEGSVCFFLYDGSWNSIIIEITNPVSISQNASTGHTDLTIGDETTPVASVGDVAALYTLDIDSSGETAHDASIYKKDRVMTIKKNGPAGYGFDVYGITINWSSTLLYEGLVNQSAPYNIVFDKDYLFIRFVRRTSGSPMIDADISIYQPGAIPLKLQDLQSAIDQSNARIDTLGELNSMKDNNIDKYSVDVELPQSASAQQVNIFSNIGLVNGDMFKLNSVNSECYFMFTDNTYQSLSPGTTQVVNFPAGKTFKNIRIIVPSLAEATTRNYSCEVIRKIWVDSSKLIISQSVPVVPPIRALVLGDSYSGMYWNYVQIMLANLPDGSSVVNLGVSSATLKNRSNDMTTYPYTSRPTSSDNTGNHNTLGSQVEKLKRLMAGTDLDQGESQIYTDESQYPNVIIIEGGKNDNYDSDEVVATYQAQLDKVVTNVYIKETAESTPVLGTATIKTPIDEVDRTCFSGAYRYLLDELLGLFPKAQIYFVTVSPLGYRNGTEVSKKSCKTAEQQRMCADIYSAVLMDWHRNGQINSIVNYAHGDGTQENPYQTRYQSGGDTSDQLHPNDRGRTKYGLMCAQVIKQSFLNFENE